MDIDSFSTKIDNSILNDSSPIYRADTITYKETDAITVCTTTETRKTYKSYLKEFIDSNDYIKRIEKDDCVTRQTCGRFNT